jgi:hypothetical protein
MPTEQEHVANAMKSAWLDNGAEPIEKIFPLLAGVALEASAEFRSEDRKAEDKFPEITQCWATLPLHIRNRWWSETDYGKQPPSDDLMEAIREWRGEQGVQK